MIISSTKSKKKKTVTSDKLLSLFTKNSSLIKLIIIISLFINLITLLGGIYLAKKKWTLIKPKIETQIKQPIVSAINRLFVTPPESINIEIDFESLQKLEQKRLEAIEQGILISSDDDFVSAKIEYDNQKIPIKLRLKGDWTDHLEGEKWSFRIHTKGDEAFMGMRYFSIQAPQTRRYLSEWLFLQTAKKENLIALRYKFIDVSINGEKKGIFAVEENFSKELIENNERREGPILKFSEDKIWETLLTYDKDHETITGLEQTSNIEPFRTSQTLGNPKLAQEFGQAQKLLSDFREGKINVEETFDLDRWSKFFALADLFGANHGVTTHNTRFYYNPITGLLEPIPFDMMTREMINSLVIEQANLLTDFPNFWLDKSFQEKYLFYLNKFSSEKYISEILAENNEEIKRLEKIINLDEQYAFDPVFLYRNSDFIRKKLNNQPAIRVTLQTNNKISVTALTELPVQITKVNDKALSQPIYIPASNRNSIPEKIILDLPDLNLTSEDVKDEINNNNVEYHFLGIQKTFTVSFDEWTESISEQRYPSSSLQPSFVQYDQSQNIYFVPSGKWQLASPWIIPAGSKLIVQAGASLDLVNSSYIISHSPIELKGDADNGVIIDSSDTTGQGLFVINAPDKSVIEYTRISNQTNIKSLGNNITGAITFYESEVEISNSLFENNHSEDLLNMVRTKFYITNSSFVGAFSDAIDVDFGSGTIVGGTFLNSTNDSIDVSGSNIEIKNVKISNAGDKGVSAGERSFVKIENTTVENSNIGFASKDGSEVIIKLSNISLGKYGLTAYQKKEEYSGATIEVWNTGNTAQVPTLIEKDSLLIQNGNPLPGIEKNVYDTVSPE